MEGKIMKLEISTTKNFKLYVLRDYVSLSMKLRIELYNFNFGKQVKK